MLDWPSSISARLVFSQFRGTLLRIGSGDIKALCPEFLGLHIAVDGVVGSRGDSKVPIEPRPSKTVGTARLIFDVGRT